MAKYLAEISHEIKRQIGILVDRKGNIEDVIVGDAQGVYISEMKRYRTGKTRFRGVRFIHTHLKPEKLSKDDLMDLALLRFDLILAIEVNQNGLPGACHQAHLLPGKETEKIWLELVPVSVNRLENDFLEFIQSLEEEFAQHERGSGLSKKNKRAILVGINVDTSIDSFNSMEELKELAVSSDLYVADILNQNRPHIDPKFVIGKGKLKELFIKTLQLNADVIIFDCELNASQNRALSDATELEVIDRTQLILDIFAKRAKSKDGKLQVELAQLKYSLPRLVLKDDFLSRITGGIGARGPGETKLEIYKRRISDRIAKLETEIETLSKRRQQLRNKRDKANVPIISIVGYTNAGKSTLLNRLTSSDVFVEDKLFATLDPTTRRLRFPEEREVIITDTVGFIRDLPKDLVNAFMATLEELREADLLLHLVDISSPAFLEQIKSVEGILSDLAIDNIPVLLVFNKMDKVENEYRIEIEEKYNTFCISALKRINLDFLSVKIRENAFILDAESHPELVPPLKFN